MDPNTKKPTKIPTLIPQTNEERAHFELGALKAKSKKQARRAKQQFSFTTTTGAGEQPLLISDLSRTIETQAVDLLKKAGPLLRMPSLADPNSILMSRTEMQNAMMAQPQVSDNKIEINGIFVFCMQYDSIRYMILVTHLFMNYTCVHDGCFYFLGSKHVR